MQIKYILILFIPLLLGFQNTCFVVNFILCTHFNGCAIVYKFLFWWQNCFTKILLVLGNSTLFPLYFITACLCPRSAWIFFYHSILHRFLSIKMHLWAISILVTNIHKHTLHLQIFAVSVLLPSSCSIYFSLLNEMIFRRGQGNCSILTFTPIHVLLRRTMAVI